MTDDERKPYDESGDLISRSALKEEITSYDREFAPDWVLNLIDNATTVDQNWRFYYDHGYKRAVLERDFARPQGEWIEKKNEHLGKCLKHLIECSVCGSAFCFDDLLRRSYCPNCGADMRGGAE